MEKFYNYVMYSVVVVFFLFQNNLLAQETKTFNYQAVIRDINSELIQNQNIQILASIVKGSQTGDAVYAESHIITTNNFGVINLKIGKGNIVNGIFNEIDWGIDRYYLKIEVDVAGGTDYVELGTVELTSVPYANYALDVKNKDDADADSTNEIQNLNLTGNQLSISNGNSVDLAIAGSYWQPGIDGINYIDGKIGIGTTIPNSKLEVQADASFTETDTLFAVKDKDGNIVFAVFPGGVKVYINATVKGSIGGFAVSGRSPTKGEEVDILTVTADSTRIFVNESTKGSIGGFAVSGRSPTKAGAIDILTVTSDSTRIFVNEPTKGSIGGFAVSGRSPTKASTDRFMNINKINISLGYQSGFSINNGTNNLFLGTQSGYFNTDGGYNSFYGYKSGYNNTLGNYNSFFGFESGLNNLSGSGNTFLGYQCGYSNTTGDENLFVGYRSGYSNTIGTLNLFVGRLSGHMNSSGSYNTFLGTQAGMSNTTGESNLFIGTVSGVQNTTGSRNLFLGSGSGNANTTGSDNCFVGQMSGYYNTTGNSNTCFGKYSGFSITTGFYNVYIGHGAGGSDSKGFRNTVVGFGGLSYNRNGYHNTAVGYHAGELNLGSNNVFLGYGAGNHDVTGSDRLYIEGNENIDYALIYGDFYGGRRMVVIDGDSIDNLSLRTFYVNGTSGGDFSWENLSDNRLKKNVVSIEGSLDKVLKLRGVNFEWKDPETREKGVRMGFIAQEAEVIIPEVVNSDGEYLSMQYAPITALLVEAVKEQQKEIEELRVKNKTLEEKLDKVDDLQKQIDELKQMMK